MAKYFATCSVGLEELLVRELSDLGAVAIVPTRGGVAFEGEKEILYRACLRLRTATRVLLQLKTFSALHATMLYDQIRRMRWDEYLDPSMTLAVDCTLGAVQPDAPQDGRKGLIHSGYVALKIKDAIVDRLREKFNDRPNVDAKDPDVRISAYLNGGKCILSLDAAGRSLHERGWRKERGDAPLKETLAAALVMLSEWKPEMPLIDPMCGSGTVAIEAALIARKIAPGLLNPAFSFRRWKDFDEKIWDRELTACENEIDRKIQPKIFAYDRDEEMVFIAKRNARAAGVDLDITIAKESVHVVKAPADAGVMVTNPPYGERIGAPEKMSGFYKQFGDVLKQRFKGWTAFVFTGNLEAAKSLGLRASKRIILFNGPIECRLLRYDLYEGTKKIRPELAAKAAPTAEIQTTV